MAEGVAEAAGELPELDEHGTEPSDTVPAGHAAHEDEPSEAQ